MLDPLVITLVAALLAHDALFPGAVAEASPLRAAALAAGAPLAIAALAHLRLAQLVRALDREGRLRRLVQGDRMLSIAKAGVGVCFAAGVLGFGWLDVVRGGAGDLVLVDEALAMTPALGALLWLWAAHYPVERRIREATILRSLDSGGGLHPIPTRAEHVLDMARHRAMLALVPIALIVAWVEGVDRALSLLAERGAIDPDAAPWLLGAGALEVAGVLGTLALTPPIVRRIWDTLPLGEGDLRRRLVDLCRRHRVRVAQILVWRTRGTTINAAVMGVFGPMRYVLLSDALLERLPDNELEAVVAHEVGHARRHHLPWLMGAVAATIGLGSLAGEAAADRLAPALTRDWGQWVDAGAIGLGLALGLWALGSVSRRFERQADAFAVQHLSGLTRDDGDDLEATPEATRAMAGALERVARLSHIPPERFTWRHGSIASRRRAVLALAGLPLNAFPIDRQVRRAKLATLAAVAALLALGAWRTNADAAAQSAGRSDWSNRPESGLLLTQSRRR